MGNVGDVFQLSANGVSLAEARIAIERLRGVAFTNKSTGIVARLSSSAKGKLVSNKATGKSKANGFTREQHNALAANIDGIYIGADLVSSRPDRECDPNIISIKRFSRNVAFGNKLAVAWITVKESRQHGHHIYSVEAIKLEALDRKVEVVSGNTPHASSASTRDIIAKVVSHIKGVFALSAKARHEKHG